MMCTFKTSINLYTSKVDYKEMIDTKQYLHLNFSLICLESKINNTIPNIIIIIVYYLLIIFLNALSIIMLIKLSL